MVAKPLDLNQAQGPDSGGIQGQGSKPAQGGQPPSPNLQGVQGPQQQTTGLGNFQPSDRSFQMPLPQTGPGGPQGSKPPQGGQPPVPQGSPVDTSGRTVTGGSQGPQNVLGDAQIAQTQQGLQWTGPNNGSTGGYFDQQGNQHYNVFDADRADWQRQMEAQAQARLDQRAAASAGPGSYTPQGNAASGGVQPGGVQTTGVKPGGQDGDFVPTPDTGPTVPAPNQTDYAQFRSETETAMFDRAMRLLNPQFDQAQESLEQRLANQGLPTSGEAATGAYGAFNDSRNTAMLNAADQAILAGSQEAQRLFSNDLANRNFNLQDYATRQGLSLQEAAQQIQREIGLGQIDASMYSSDNALEAALAQAAATRNAAAANANASRSNFMAGLGEQGRQFDLNFGFNQQQQGFNNYLNYMNMLYGQGTNSRNNWLQEMAFLLGG